ncbi:hypothetical protein CFP65_3095 [Kitasatospora sp. MMS16-BH015]|uniref:hypothetical protein n=1 Tax=Kitasatospora sp. MMS16-BH015 TaxID=2018025 RepID=UPI000CA0F61C|nr:hypothetical protein [Kitasatospora sp. MMS16-BH015]AUG77902.1 hypothetical protein CFP65_3095 [Kitasatospora sp. MMS16-BH015]
MTDRVTERYLAESLADGSRLRTAMAEVDLPPLLSASSGQRLFPRPLFVGEREVRSFAEDVIGVFDLLTTLPERLFDGDLARYCAALAINERRTRLITRFGGAKPPQYGRADMYHDGTAFRLLEFNVASELGGVERSGELPRLLLGVDSFARFAKEHDLKYTDTGRLIAETLRTAGAQVAPGREPVVALLEAPGGLAGYGDAWRAFEELMLGFGLDFMIGEISDVKAEGDRVLLNGRKLDVVLRCYSADEILEAPDGEALAEPVFRAHEAGTLVLWTPMESNLYNNKACLAMLSDPRARSSFDAAEQAVIDRVVPWTRAIGGAFALPSAALVEECMDRRTELILKPNARYGGSGIVAGWEVEEQAWRLALESVDAAGAIVQQRVVPRAEPVVSPETGAVEEWQAAWGLFVTPQGYAGSYARALPANESAVIGIGAHAMTRTAGVFTYQDGEGL